MLLNFFRLWQVDKKNSVGVDILKKKFVVRKISLIKFKSRFGVIQNVY